MGIFARADHCKKNGIVIGQRAPIIKFLRRFGNFMRGGEKEVLGIRFLEIALNFMLANCVPLCYNSKVFFI